MQQRLHCTGIIYQLKQDRMCNCNTVTRDAITIAIWSGLRPDTHISAYVLNVVSGSLPLPRPLAHYVRSLGLRRAGDLSIL